MSLEKASTRREALRKMVLISAGAFVGVLGAYGTLYFLRNTDAEEQRPKKNAVEGSSLLSVEVVYAGMSSDLGLTEEEVQLPGPASLSDLVAYVCQRHPLLETMPFMQILLNGVAPGGNPALQSGDEVAFVTSFAGG